MTTATGNGKDVTQVVRAAVAQHGATRGVGERLEYGVEREGLRFNHGVEYLPVPDESQPYG